MLNRTKLIHALDSLSEALFVDYSHEYDLVRSVWQDIVDDVTFIHKVKATQAPWPVPIWEGRLDGVTFVDRGMNSYQVASVDGSQIYPDRHQGTSCFLINIGSVSISYSTSGASVYLDSVPSVYMEEDLGYIGMSAELVNCKRQELEFRAGAQLCAMMQGKKNQDGNKTPLVFLCDGSLIFWHLEAKDTKLRDLFLAKYLLALHDFRKSKTLLAGYISLPRSRDLLNLVRLWLCDFDPEASDAYKQVDHCIDTTIGRFFLRPFTRSIIFKSQAKICEQYPDDLRPYFFYLHVGDEIGRVEVPAWIANDQNNVDSVARVILDQSIKGRGYPVAIAEAHEQAVVKGPDREFFYHLINKIGFEKKKHLAVSQKSMKKRGIGI